MNEALDATTLADNAIRVFLDTLNQIGNLPDNISSMASSALMAVEALVDVVQSELPSFCDGRLVQYGNESSDNNQINNKFFIPPEKNVKKPPTKKMAA